MSFTDSGNHSDGVKEYVAICFNIRDSYSIVLEIEGNSSSTLIVNKICDKPESIIRNVLSCYSYGGWSSTALDTIYFQKYHLLKHANNRPIFKWIKLIKQYIY